MRAKRSGKARGRLGGGRAEEARRDDARVLLPQLVIYFSITWFPSYLVDARGFDLPQLGISGVLPAPTADA
jgi:hypothetical protein